MRTSTKRKIMNVALTVGYVLVILCICSLIALMGSCAVKDIKGPTQQEKDAKWARAVAAKQEGLKELAASAQVGENTAFIPMSPYAYWYGDREGSYNVGAEDIVPIAEIFCRTHNVRQTAQPVALYSGRENYIIGFTIIFEPNQLPAK